VQPGIVVDREAAADVLEAYGPLDLTGIVTSERSGRSRGNAFD
jgi:hypothetical protein